MSDDDVILSELRRRFEAVSIERDTATLALSKVREEEEKKRARLRAEIRDLRQGDRLRRLTHELESVRVVSNLASARALALEERLAEARRHYRTLRADYRALLKLLDAQSAPNVTAISRRTTIA